MLKRTLTALAMAAVGLPAVIYGGVFYFMLMGAFLVGGAWEYVRLYRAVKHEPDEFVTVGGVLVILTARFFFADVAAPVLVATILLAMAAHLFAFERGRDQSALDFGITVAGIVYLGWIGAYLLDLRSLVNDEMGVWWLMMVLPLVWAADTGGYSIGAAYGKHKMAPRLSPKKSWEGYFAGIFTAVLVGTFFAYAFSSMGPQPLAGFINPVQGGLLGLVIGALAPLGDLGESMFKRQSGMKDSSNIFPGHGGFLDRIDSWIWGAAIGYFLIQYFIL
ncbi:MAG TPA: phosphatidate cytidylyltransferase [Anaerolineales bacterium]|nr:phosphatidate cytidylyltransferase [Anaerolineales bacterium]